MTPAPAGALGSVPTGNTFDKYGSANPLVRRLMAGFEASLDALLALAGPQSILDIGCGEGVLSERWARRLPSVPVLGLDLPDPKLQAQWATRRAPNLEFQAGDAERMPFADSEHDLVAAIETLEHLAHPELALAEMARVARRHLLVSVPREPLWRVLNLVRGSYIRQFGNTPGHLNHWSARAFRKLLARHGDLLDLRTPLPWTIALVRVG